MYVCMFVCFNHSKQKGKNGANLKTQLVQVHQGYRILVKWLTLENEKKTAVSQDWRHKKDS